MGAKSEFIKNAYAELWRNVESTEKRRLIREATKLGKPVINAIQAAHLKSYLVSRDVDDWASEVQKIGLEYDELLDELKSKYGGDTATITEDMLRLFDYNERYLRGVYESGVLPYDEEIKTVEDLVEEMYYTGAIALDNLFNLFGEDRTYELLHKRPKRKYKYVLTGVGDRKLRIVDAYWEVWDYSEFDMGVRLTLIGLLPGDVKARVLAMAVSGDKACVNYTGSAYKPGKDVCFNIEDLRKVLVELPVVKSEWAPLSDVFMQDAEKVARELAKGTDWLRNFEWQSPKHKEELTVEDVAEVYEINEQTLRGLSDTIAQFGYEQTVNTLAADIISALPGTKPESAVRVAREIIDKAPVDVVLVTGKTYPGRRDIAALGGIYSRPLGAWVVPLNRRKEIEQLAQKRGYTTEITTVNRADTKPLTYAERREREEEKELTKAEQLRDRVARREQEIEALEKELAPYDDMAFWTEPIHPGDRGRRQKNQREALRAKMVRIAELRKEAQELRDKADRMEGYVERRAEDIRYMDRRLKEAEANLRGVKNDIEGTSSRSGYKPATGDWLLKLRMMENDYRQQVDYWTAKIKEAGGIQYSQENVKTGDMVKIRGQWCEVLRANPTTVTVMTPQEFKLKYPYAEIQALLKEEEEVVFEPWERTQEEFIRLELAKDSAYQNALKQGDAANLKIEEDRARKSAKRKHEAAVVNAILANKPVRLEVLEDYPDLRENVVARRLVADSYIQKIRNEAKRKYAEAYNTWIINGKPKGKEPSYPGLSVMAAQAVRMELNEIYAIPAIEEEEEEVAEEKPVAEPSQEVKDWMLRAHGLKDYKGDRSDRIFALKQLINRGSYGRVTHRKEAFEMANALAKDLGYVPYTPEVKVSWERHFAQQIAHETGTDVYIIENSAVISSVEWVVKEEPKEKEQEAIQKLNKYRSLIIEQQKIEKETHYGAAYPRRWTEVKEEASELYRDLIPYLKQRVLALDPSLPESLAETVSGVSILDAALYDGETILSQQIPMNLKSFKKRVAERRPAYKEALQEFGIDLDELDRIRAERWLQLPDGKGKGRDILDHNLEQIKKGIKVEMEHTRDPVLALEIAIDHLTEFPDYYTRLAKMEKEAEKLPEGKLPDWWSEPTIVRPSPLPEWWPEGMSVLSMWATIRGSIVKWCEGDKYPGYERYFPDLARSHGLLDLDELGVKTTSDVSKLEAFIKEVPSMALSVNGVRRLSLIYTEGVGRNKGKKYLRIKIRGPVRFGGVVYCGMGVPITEITGEQKKLIMKFGEIFGKQVKEKRPPLEGITEIELPFTSSILGAHATQYLKRGEVTQTIRGDEFAEKVDVGTFVIITLDGEEIARGRIKSKDRVNLGELSVADISRGGFETGDELTKALHAAGYRFKPLSEYESNRIQFEWLSPVLADLLTIEVAEKTIGEWLDAIKDSYEQGYTKEQLKPVVITRLGDGFKKYTTKSFDEADMDRIAQLLLDMVPIPIKVEEVEVVKPPEEPHPELAKIPKTISFTDDLTPSAIDSQWIYLLSIEDEIREDTAPQIKKLKEELERMKGERGKEANAKKKKLRERIEYLDAQAKVARVMAEQLFMEAQDELRKRVLPKLIEAGITDESKQQEAMDMITSSLFERPYIERTWKMTISEIVDGAIQEYKPELLDPAKIREKILEAFSELDREGGGRVMSDKLVEHVAFMLKTDDLPMIKKVLKDLVNEGILIAPSGIDWVIMKPSPPAKEPVHVKKELVAEEEMVPLLSEVLIFPAVIIIGGKRRSGKTATGYLIVELVPTEKKFVLGLPESAWHLLPKSITPLPLTKEILQTLPIDSVFLIDEASLSLYAKEHNTSLSKVMDEIMLKSAQRGQTFIFISHSLRKLYVGVILDADVVIFKEPSPFQVKYERTELKPIVLDAERAFSKISPELRLMYAFVITSSFTGLVETPLPSFWKDELGLVWRSYIAKMDIEEHAYEKTIYKALEEEVRPVPPEVVERYAPPRRLPELAPPIKVYGRPIAEVWDEGSNKDRAAWLIHSGIEDPEQIMEYHRYNFDFLPDEIKGRLLLE